jgi:ankyrin repeat protein
MDINSYYTDGNNEYTPLKRAIFRRDIRLIEYLLKNGANVNTIIGNNELEYSEENTVMHYILSYCNFSIDNNILELLLEYNGDPNILDKNNCNVLHILLKTLNFPSYKINISSPKVLSLINILLENGVNFQQKNISNHTPLDMLKDNNSKNYISGIINEFINKVKTINYVVEEKNFPNISTDILIQIADYLGRKKCLKSLELVNQIKDD